MTQASRQLQKKAFRAHSSQERSQNFNEMRRKTQISTRAHQSAGKAEYFPRSEAVQPQHEANWIYSNYIQLSSETTAPLQIWVAIWNTVRLVVNRPPAIFIWVIYANLHRSTVVYFFSILSL